MDGTVDGRLVLPQPAPRPVAPPPVGGNMLHVDHTTVPQPPATPVPVPQPAPLQQQFSQLTPVYAPGPTNTVADIPQPAVKGIEFVQSPTPVQPQPQPQANTLSQQVAMSGAIVMPAEQQVPEPVVPVTPPVSSLPPMPPPTVPLPTMPPMPPAIRDTPPEAPLVGQPVIATPAEQPAASDPPLSERDAHIQAVENKIEDVDLDQTIGVVPEPIVNPAPAAAAPVETSKADIARNYFQDAGTESVPIADTPRRFSLKNLDPRLLKRGLIIAGIVIVLGVGGYFVANGIIGSQQAAEQTHDEPIAQTPTVTEPEFTDSEESTTTPAVTPDESAPAESAVPTTPTPAADPTPVASVAVPTAPNTGLNDADFADLPRFLKIDKLNINARIEQIGVTSSGVMGVPKDIWNAGWYIGSAAPGQPGAAFIDGHSSSSRGALFGSLDTLVTGDQIKVERNDGTIVKYKVARVSVVSRHDVDMAAMLQPYDTHKNGLNILSCVGKWIASENTLENRVLVYAVQL